MCSAFFCEIVIVDRELQNVGCNGCDGNGAEQSPCVRTDCAKDVRYNPPCHHKLMMLQQARDVLTTSPKTSATEIEFRFHVPLRLFEQSRNNWVHWYARDVDPVSSVVQCNNDSDLRCVDGNWERKRVVDRLNMRVSGKLACRMSVAVESAAVAPPDVSQWNVTRHRKRWTYGLDDWVVSWTELADSSEVEIEFAGDIERLTTSEDMCRLHIPFKIVVACLSFMIHAGPYCEPGIACNFVRSRKNHCTCGIETHAYMQRCMRAQQPVSLSCSRSRRIGEVCVSLKLDGIRAMLFFDIVNTVPVCWMMLRDGKMYSIPCIECDVSMILDGEWVGDTFTAFDIAGLNHVSFASMSFKRRLKALRSVSLPTVLPFTVDIKQFYPIRFPEEFVEQVSAAGVDGVIIHSTDAPLLGRGVPMYKWKQHHTIDVHCVDGEAFAENGSLDIQFTDPPANGLWECRVVGASLHPLKRRTDKTTANALHVCNEILEAHASGIDILDIPDIFT